MMSHIDMFGACMVLVILRDGYSGLIITEQDGGVIEWSGNFSEEGM